MSEPKSCGNCRLNTWTDSPYGPCMHCLDFNLWESDGEAELSAIRARVAELEQTVEQLESDACDERDAVAAAESRVTDLKTALSALLEAAERQAAGFPLPAEEWFAVRDYARARLPEKKEVGRE